MRKDNIIVSNPFLRAALRKAKGQSRRTLCRPVCELELRTTMVAVVYPREPRSHHGTLTRTDGQYR